MHLPEQFYQSRKLEHLVENQTSYTLEHAALHIFETHHQAEKVMLQFRQPVLASMFEGKKVMHLRDKPSFDFLPGESLILPSEELMCIDFPEARMDTPTRCLAMAISEEKIEEVIRLMNETMPKVNGEEWKFMEWNFHFTNDPGIYRILQRLIYLFTENHPSKDLFVGFMLQELLVRILQANEQKYYQGLSAEHCHDTRLGVALQYIQKNLHRSITVKELSAKACMSESSFHRAFKNELGISPIRFINEARIRLATRLLKDPSRQVKDVYLDCGFECRSYFNRQFKKQTKMSPKEYRNS